MLKNEKITSENILSEEILSENILSEDDADGKEQLTASAQIPHRERVFFNAR